MLRHSTSPITLIAFIVASCFAPAARAADSVQVALGGGAAKTEWSKDAAANTSLKLGYAPYDYLTFYGMTRLGYASTNTRIYEFFSFGAQLSTTAFDGDVRPFARVSACHQHEETVDLLRAEPVGALAGVANGLHHRTGFEGGVGLEVALLREGPSEIFASIEGTNIWFFDSNGPHFYWGAGAALGFNYEL